MCEERQVQVQGHYPPTLDNIEASPSQAADAEDGEGTGDDAQSAGAAAQVDSLRKAAATKKAPATRGNPGPFPNPIENNELNSGRPHWFGLAFQVPAVNKHSLSEHLKCLKSKT